jgi:hypothetical protein
MITKLSVAYRSDTLFSSVSDIYHFKLPLKFIWLSLIPLFARRQRRKGRK